MSSPTPPTSRLKRNWTQQATRNLSDPPPPPPPSRPHTRISFGNTTSSNNANTTNYTKKHNNNNTSQSRQSQSRGKRSPSYREIPNYEMPVSGSNEYINRAKELHNARVLSNEESYKTPIPYGVKPSALSPNLAAKYAQISANSNTVENIQKKINEDTKLSATDKHVLKSRARYEYESINLPTKWNSLPEGVNRTPTVSTWRRVFGNNKASHTVESSILKNSHKKPNIKPHNKHTRKVFEPIKVRLPTQRKTRKQLRR